jgi:hypothetical protein
MTRCVTAVLLAELHRLSPLDLSLPLQRKEVVWTDQRQVGSVSLDRPNDVKECPAALVPKRASKARDVLYSDGAVLSLVEEDKLKVYDLVTGDVLKVPRLYTSLFIITSCMRGAAGKRGVSPACLLASEGFRSGGRNVLHFGSSGTLAATVR